MVKIILQSACVGLGAVVAVAFFGIFVGLLLAGFFLSNAPPGGAEVGWDLVTMARNFSPTVLLFPLLVFAAGFVLAFRHLYRRSSRT
jgi:hypothetical protein